MFADIVEYIFMLLAALVTHIQLEIKPVSKSIYIDTTIKLTPESKKRITKDRNSENLQAKGCS